MSAPAVADRRLRMLAGGRVVVGGGAVVAPRLTGRAFGIDAAANPAVSYVARLFGVRALLMAGLITAATPEQRRQQLRAGVAVDVVDALAAVLAGRAGQLSRRSSTLACAAAVVEAMLGTWLLLSDDAQCR